MNKISKEELEEVINEFQYEGKLVFIKPYGSGHINDTFLLKYEIGCKFCSNGTPILKLAVHPF